MANFTTTDLQNIRGRADVLWIDGQQGATPPEVGVLQAIIAKQTAKVERFKQTDGGCVTAELNWIKETALEVTDNTACEIGGTTGDSANKTYTLGVNKVVNFTVKEEEHCGNEYSMEEAIASLMNDATKAMEEYAASVAVAKIEANKGVNALTAGKGNVVGTETYIDSAQWDAKLMAYFKRCAIINKFSNPYLISGNNMFENVWIADKEYGNWDGKGNVAMYAAMQMYFDLFNIDAVNDPDLKTYMLNKGALAFVSNAYYAGKGIVDYGIQKRWSETSKVIPGLVYDVHYDTTCGANDFMEHNFKIKAKFDIFASPVNALYPTRTGILSYINGVAP